MLHRHPFLALLSGSYLVFVGWLTLTPQPITGDHQQLIHRVLDGLHRRGHVEQMGYEELEFLANIGLFVPVGVFLLIFFGAGGWWLALAASFGGTVFIETMQTQIPGRVPDERDLIANTLGGAIGIVLALLLTLPATRRRRRRRREQRQARRAAALPR